MNIIILSSTSNVTTRARLLAAAVLFWTTVLYLRAGRAATCQKYIMCLILRQNLLRYLAHPYINFYNFTLGQIVHMWPRLSTPVAFDTVWFQNGATYQKHKTCHYG